jgi:hypothetical protein
MLQRLFDDQREAFQKSDLFSSRVVSSFIEEKKQMPWIPSIRRNIKIPAPAQSWFTEATLKETTRVSANDARSSSSLFMPRDDAT